MPDAKQLIALTTEFAVPTRARWETLAREAAGVGALSELATTSDDGIRIEPLYTAADGPSAVPVPGIRAAAPALRPLVAEPTPEAANAAIRDEIAGGATEILLQIESPGMAGIRLGGRQDLDRVLQDIAPEQVAIHLRHAAGPDHAAPLLLRWWQNGPANAGGRGSLGIDPIGAAASGGIPLARLAESGLAPDAEMLRQCLETAPRGLALRASGLPYHEAGASEAQELAAMLATTLAYLRACDDRDVAPEDAAPRIELELGADADLFLTIAKLRAARLLWARLGEECGFAGGPNLSVQTSARMMSAIDPETNMVRNAMAALGAGIGGADAVTVLPHTHLLGRPDPGARRLARNTGHILGKEAQIGAVADAAAGSWAIESLTGSLCATAWTLFTKIEAEGGMAAALASGWIKARIHETCEARARDVAAGTRVLVGATAYRPQTAEPVTAEPWSVPPIAGAEAAALRPVRLEQGAEP